MAVKIGRQLYFGLKKESVRLTAEATGDTWLPVESMAIQPTYNYMEDTSSISRREEMLGHEIETFHSEGDISALTDADTIGTYFYYLFGSVSSLQEATSGAYKHTFTSLQNTQLPTFTAFYERPNTGDLKSNGCTIGQIEIAGAVNEKVTLTATVMGLSEVAAASQTPAYTKPTRYLQSRFAKINYANNIAGLSSPSTLDVRSFSATLNNNSEVDEAIGSENPVDIQSRSFTGLLQFNAVMKSTDFETFRAAGTKKAYELIIENTAVPELGTASGLQPLVRIRFAPSLVKITYALDLGDTVKFDAEVMAEYSASDSFAVQGYVQNEKTSY